LKQHNVVIFRCISTKLGVEVYIFSLNSCVNFREKNLHLLLKYQHKSRGGYILHEVR